MSGQSGLTPELIAKVTKDTVTEYDPRNVLGETTRPIEKGRKDIGDDSGQGK